MPFQNLMVSLANTEHDSDLIRYAAAVSAICRPQMINFVHVMPHANHHPTNNISYDEMLEKIRAEVGKIFGESNHGTKLEYHVLRGERLDLLLEFAATHEIDLILAGHGKNARSTTARRLAMKAPSSIWMVPQGSPAACDKILVPVDLSPPSADALSLATALASLTGASEVFVLHVYFNETVVNYDEYDTVIRGREKESFDRFIAPINLHGIRVNPLFEDCANVAHAIERVAERQHVNLVVMGTRGRSRASAILLGSETDHVMREGLHPVLAVKHFGSQLNLLQTLLDKNFRHRSGTKYS